MNTPCQLVFIVVAPAWLVRLLELILQAHVMCSVCTAAGVSELARAEMAMLAAFDFILWKGMRL